MSALLEELRWRGLLQDMSEGAAGHLAEAPRRGYIGFDPTASSLHVGNLLVVMDLVHLQRHGHTPIALVGGGTGLIGDPSGRDTERQLLTKEQAAENAEGIRGQLEHFLDFGATPNAAVMRNNLDWLSELALVDFLRDIGKHFSVNQLMAKESVRRRLEDPDAGLSYAEFSYILMQSYDFLELYRRDACTVQFGGSDQWGNITAGTDLIRRVDGGKAFGVVSPLVTNASGRKFGKTESGGVWLDPALTSPYAFYQFWLNTDDADAVRYLKYFSLLSREEIAELEAATEAEPYKRAAQRALGGDVTRRVHGETGLAKALQATDALFGGDLSGLSAGDIADVFGDVPSSDMSKEELVPEGKPIVDLLEESGIATSKGDARRSIEGGGIYVNNRRVESVDYRVSAEDVIDGRFLVLRKGKKSYQLVAVRGAHHP
jgi:tyrosyl-tRNA synthetase